MDKSAKMLITTWIDQVPRSLNDYSNRQWAGLVSDFYLPRWKNFFEFQMDVLTGKKNPSGKLPMSFPYCVGQAPVSYNEYSTGRPNLPGMKERFRSKYLDIPNAPLYPFGYGLTYGKTEVTKAEMRDDGEHYTITATVKNEDCAVHEILQVYVRDNESEFAVRNHSLCAFKAVSLGANETCDVEITVPKAALEIVDDTGTRRVDSRSFTFFVGTSQPDDRSAELLGTRPVAVELKL